MDRVAKTETEDEVLDLAEELYAWMVENETETDNHDSGEYTDSLPTGEETDGEPTESDEGTEGAEGDEADDTENGESSDAILYGFIIRNGFASEGGGIRMVGSTPTLRHLIIEDNEFKSNTVQCRIDSGLYGTNDNDVGTRISISWQITGRIMNPVHTPYNVSIISGIQTPSSSIAQNVHSFPIHVDIEDVSGSSSQYDVWNRRDADLFLTVQSPTLTDGGSISSAVNILVTYWYAWAVICVGSVILIGLIIVRRRNAIDFDDYDDHIEKMFSAFQNQEYSDLILFILMTGARCGEALGLRWDELETVDQNRVELQPKLKGRVFKIGDRVGDNKGNGRRFLFLNDIAKKVLDRQRGKDSEFVFIFSKVTSHPKRHLGKYSETRREQYNTDEVAQNSKLTRYKDWQRAKKEVGLPIQVKDLKSTFATRKRSNDIHLYDEKDCLGHVVTDVTRRYAQADWLKLVTILNRIFPTDPTRTYLKVVNG